MFVLPAAIESLAKVRQLGGHKDRKAPMFAMSTRSWIIVGGVAWMAGAALGVALCRASKDGDQWTKDGSLSPNRTSALVSERGRGPSRFSEAANS